MVSILLINITSYYAKLPYSRFLKWDIIVVKFYLIGPEIGKPTEMLHLAFPFLLTQLIAILIHYPCTVALIGLAD